MDRAHFLESTFGRYRRSLDRIKVHGAAPLRRLALVTNLLWLRLVRQSMAPSELPLYLDVGAAGGIAPKWRLAARLGLVRIEGFEPDPVARKELERAFPKARFLPFALGEADETKRLHITEDPHCASCLLPDREMVDRYPVGKNFRVVSTINVPVRSFASLVDSELVRPPDFLKLDVQGYEFQVLRGFAGCLGDVLAIELESHTKPLYEGQKTADELIRFLDVRGFWLRRFEQQGSFEGECIEANLFFSRPPASLTGENLRKLVLWEVLSNVPDASLYHFSG